MRAMYYHDIITAMSHALGTGQGVAEPPCGTVSQGVSPCRAYQEAPKGRTHRPLGEQLLAPAVHLLARLLHQTLQGSQTTMLVFCATMPTVTLGRGAQHSR